MTSAIGDLIVRLKEILPSDKLITMATFSVGADPVDDCTAPGSVHCGEIIDLLTQFGCFLDIVNVMAYDAGADWAENKYQIAMENYFALVGEKAVLGLDN